MLSKLTHGLIVVSSAFLSVEMFKSLSPNGQALWLMFLIGIWCLLAMWIDTEKE